MKFRGLNGTIEVVDDKIRIIREKLLDGAFHKKGTFVFPLSSGIMMHYHKGGDNKWFFDTGKKGVKTIKKCFFCYEKR